MAGALAYEHTQPERCIDGRVPDLADLVEAIGHDDFGVQLLSFFSRLAEADHCAAYQMRNYELTEIASIAQQGRCVPNTYLGTYDINRRFRHLGQSNAVVDTYSLPQVREMPSGSAVAPQGILILGRRTDALYCVRILRLTQREQLAEEAIWQLQDIADLLLSLVARHQDLTHAKPTSFTALTSLKQIQERILRTKSLSRREGEVCARILYGYSSCDIAVDLGIGKESVMTYRKRAYQHLGISCQRELLMWYLEQVPNFLCN